MNLPRLIMLEGPSGSGKSSFLDRFLEQHGYRDGRGYYNTHFGAAPGDTPEEVAEHYAEILEFLRGQRLIVDRYFMSNVIYATLLGNQVSMGSHQVDAVLKRIEFWYGQSYATLLFLPDLGTLRARNADRDRGPFMKTLAGAVHLFTTCDQYPRLHPLTIDNSNLTPHQAYDRGITLLENYA